MNISYNQYQMMNNNPLMFKKTPYTLEQLFNQICEYKVFLVNLKRAVLLGNQNYIKKVCLIYSEWFQRWKKISCYEAIKDELSMFEDIPTNFQKNIKNYTQIMQNLDISETLDINIVQVDGKVPFLYSDKQEIFIENGIDIYEIRFKFDEYNNEVIEIYDQEFNDKMIDNCQIKEKEVICKITKSEIEEILQYDEEKFDLAILMENYGVLVSYTTLGIIFNYKNITKENIYVDIIKLQEKVNERNHYIAYETNVSSINNVNSGIFYLDFNNSTNSMCHLKKSENTSLLLLCRLSYDGTYSLKPTYRDTEIISQNILYNFIIVPIKNDETFIVNDYYGMNFYNSYPRTLDFTKQDSITINLIPGADFDITKEKIKLNPESDYLECKNLQDLKQCIIPLSHFDYEDSGYYNMYYVNSNNTLSQLYEVTPFNVILPERNILKLRIKREDNYNSIKIGPKGILYFITNYNDDAEKKIFDPSDIEEKTEFQTKVIDSENNNYDVNCRLWKPKNNKIVILCELDEELKSAMMITLNNSRLIYKDCYISIYSETFIYFSRYGSIVPFLYSSNQIIDLNNSTEFYELRFKYEYYNNDDNTLYLSGSRDNYIILDNCEIIENELVCKISKEKLESVLLYNNEPFKLGTMNNYIGTLGSDTFKFVYDINIIYDISDKVDVNVTITRLLENVTETNSLIAYETNVDSIPDLWTNIFKIDFL